MTHTGGKWEAHGSLVHAYFDNGTGTAVAQLLDPTPQSYLEPHKLDLDSATWEEAMGNGKLMAAAPKLYDLLKQALGHETSSDCFANHHGDCEGHGTGPLNECWVKQTEELFAKLEAEKTRGDE